MKRGITLALACLLVVAAVGVAAGCGGGSDTTTTAGATDTSAAADGAAVFASVCSGCHGADGTGGTGPDLTSRTNLTKERIVDQVTNGGTAMPAYGNQLSSDEIGAVADYVLSDIVKQ